MLLRVLHVRINLRDVILKINNKLCFLMKGRPDMHTSKKKKEYSDDSKEFLISLINEYEKNLSNIMDKKRMYKSHIAEKEAFISSLGQIKKESASLFSPNSKELNTKEYELELQTIREKLGNIEIEEQELRNKIQKLVKITNLIIEKEPYNFNLSINMLEIQEQDRQRIARDLHDSTVQNLASLIHKCELCSRLINLDPVRTKLEINTMTNTIKSVINEIREIIYNLKPMSLDDLGLLSTIERFANQLMSSHDIMVHINHSKEEKDILPVIKLALFRMIQEACNNTIKHADAKNINIDIEYKGNHISLSIMDDGKGFNTDSKKDCVAPDYSGYGLYIMKERVYLLNGTMEIESTINKGTIVTITVPITNSEGEV